VKVDMDIFKIADICCIYVITVFHHVMLAYLFCTDRPYLPSIIEHVVINWERLRLAWQVRYNPVYNTTYTAQFWNRFVMKYYSVHDGFLPRDAMHPRY